MKKWKILQVVNGRPGLIYEDGFKTKDEAIGAIQRYKLEDIENGWAPGEIAYYVVDSTSY